MPGKKTKERLANLQKGPPVDWISMDKCESCDFKSNVEGYI